MGTIRKIWLTTICDVNMMVTALWYCHKRGHSIITPPLGIYHKFLFLEYDHCRSCKWPIESTIPCHKVVIFLLDLIWFVFSRSRHCICICSRATLIQINVNKKIFWMDWTWKFRNKINFLRGMAKFLLKWQHWVPILITIYQSAKTLILILRLFWSQHFANGKVKQSSPMNWSLNLALLCFDILRCALKMARPRGDGLVFKGVRILLCKQKGPNAVV